MGGSLLLRAFRIELGAELLDELRVLAGEVLVFVTAGFFVDWFGHPRRASWVAWLAAHHPQCRDELPRPGLRAGSCSDPRTWGWTRGRPRPRPCRCPAPRDRSCRIFSRSHS